MVKTGTGADTAVSKKDREILRGLGEEKAEIAMDPVNREREDLWRRLNDLDPVRPMVQIFQIPWNEMNVDDELTLRCGDPFCRDVEGQLRRTIYQWKHMPGDMVVKPAFGCPRVIRDTGFGLKEDSEVIRLEEGSTAPSRLFHPLIREEEDLAKIRMPEITVDDTATEVNLRKLGHIFDGILDVEVHGISGFWFAPWDILVTWWGVQEVLTDLALRPDLVHKGMKRLVDAYLHRLDQYVEMNLLSLNNTGTNATADLPADGFDPGRVRTIDMWSTGAAQIFSEVSPAMHEEFAVDHEIRFFSRFGLNYYGCCEPLHKKVDVSRKIPRLRKISMSPWVNVEEGARNVGTDLVFARKPNPAVLAGSRFDLDYAEKELVDCLEITSRYRCPVEVVMKDISTVGHEPRRLWRWADMAAETVLRYPY